MLKVRSAQNSGCIYIYIYRCALAFLLLLLFSAISAGAVYADNLDYNVTVKPSLKLTVSSNSLVLNLNPANHVFDSIGLNTTVSTNNENGYKLYLNSDATNLVNTIDSTYTIPTLTTTVTDATSTNFPVNKWGYRISSVPSANIGDSSIVSTTDYFPFVSGRLISQSSLPTNGVSSTLDFATKIDYEKPAGQYNIALNFKALPQVTEYYMQDLAGDSTLSHQICTEAPTMIMDKRDGHTYAIARLKDGKCWMVQNLRLGENLETETGAMVLTDEDTDISSTDTYNPRTEFVLANKDADGVMPGVITPDGRAWIWDNSAFYCTTNYGCYYNFYTATAGVKAEGPDVAAANNTDITTTICPKGWTMPTGGEHITSGESQHFSEWQALINNYGYGVDSYDTVVARLLANPISAVENTNGMSLPGLLFGGSYYTSGAGGMGAASAYQTRTIASAAVNYMFILYNGSISSVGRNNRCDARPIRCILTES